MQIGIWQWEDGFCVLAELLRQKGTNIKKFPRKIFAKGMVAYIVKQVKKKNLFTGKMFDLFYYVIQGASVEDHVGEPAVNLCAKPVFVPLVFDYFVVTLQFLIVF